MFMDDYYMILPVLSEQILGERFFKDIPIDDLLGQNKMTKDSNGNFVDINNNFI